MNDASLDSLIRVVSEATGLNIREQDVRRLVDVVQGRIRACGLGSTEAYCRLLAAGGEEGKTESGPLVAGLTTGETYFFRDRGQFSLLKLTILPELIEARKPQRILRVWSAGCATGEEPYSVAMLVDELIPDRGDWQIDIVGTDVNEESIAKARAAHYGQWSFRLMNDDPLMRYFAKVKDKWALCERIRRMVRFEKLNLTAGDPAVGGSSFRDMDLVLCRNVFIYFSPDVVSMVASRMADTLREGGYLMTGHGEIRVTNRVALTPKVFPEAVIYQKKREVPRAAAPEPAMPKPLDNAVQRRVHGAGYGVAGRATGPATGDVKAGLARVEALLNEGRYLSALREAEALRARAPGNFDVHHLMAQAYASAGEYENAVRSARQASRAEPLRMEPFYLLAQIARERGNLDEEKEMLNRVIYLSPGHIPAYLELGIIYENDGDAARAARMRGNALELLGRLPRDAPVLPYEGMTAGELIEHVEKLTGGA